MRLKTNLIVAVACVLWPLSSFANVTPLKVAVIGGFSQTFKHLMPVLSRQMSKPIEMQVLSIPAIQAELKKANFDLIITAALDQSATFALPPDLKTMVIAYSPVVLWCPDPDIQMRVRINDTLKNKKIKTVALSPVGTPMGDLVREQLVLPSHIQLKIFPHALSTWQAAQQGDADCAFTLLSLARPNSQYQFLPHRGVKIIAVIPKSSGNADAASQLLKLLERPLFRARIQHYGYS